MRLVPDVAALSGLGLVLWAAWGAHRYVGAVVTGLLLMWAAEAMDRSGE